MTDTAAEGPLKDLVVIEMGTLIAGPFCGQILGDFGADVIKIEHPEHGDSMRGHGHSKDGLPLWWKEISRNKRTLALSLSKPDGAEAFRELAATADVIVENFRPGTFERWGLDPVELRAQNPDLITLRLTGFGQTGPYAHRAGFGTLAEAMSGFAAMTGPADGPPTLPSFGLADSIAGIAARPRNPRVLPARHDSASPSRFLTSVHTDMSGAGSPAAAAATTSRLRTQSKPSGSEMASADRKSASPRLTPTVASAQAMSKRRSTPIADSITAWTPRPPTRRDVSSTCSGDSHLGSRIADT